MGTEEAADQSAAEVGGRQWGPGEPVMVTLRTTRVKRRELRHRAHVAECSMNELIDRLLFPPAAPPAADRLPLAIEWRPGPEAVGPSSSPTA